MEKIEIRRITTEEIDQLQNIGRQTFYETFSGANSTENMQAYLEEGFSLEKLEKELTNKDSEFYFATSGDQIIGYLKINFASAQTEIRDLHSLEIERIYVLQAFQGQRIGQMLYAKCLEIANLRNLKYVWLGVWNQNQKAIRFYEKNGFVAFDKHIFKLGDDEQTDLLMKLSLEDIE